MSKFILYPLWLLVISFTVTFKRTGSTILRIDGIAFTIFFILIVFFEEVGIVYKLLLGVFR